MYLLFGVLYVVGASLAAHASSTSATFRAAVGIELLANVAFVATALALFALLRGVNELAALAMVLIVVTASAVGYAELSFSTRATRLRARQLRRTPVRCSRACG